MSEPDIGAFFIRCWQARSLWCLPRLFSPAFSGNLRRWRGLRAYFTLIGFIIHLVLDEAYSVDIEGAELKRSFGTAFKLIDFNSLSASGLMGAALALAIFLAPPSKGFSDMVRTPTLFAFLKERLLPKGKWFQPRVADTSATLKSGRGRTRRAP